MTQVKTSRAESAPLPAASPLRMLDWLSEGILLAMTVFAPWAFGTTQTWSMQIMNAGGYGLGGLLALKWFLRWRGRIRAGTPASHRTLPITLATITLLILAWCFVAAANAQFTYIPGEFRADPNAHVKWLPHSLDERASWRVFWNWLALAFVFWAVRDWLLNDLSADGRKSTRRLRRLIWVLVINGALVGLEGIFQRLSGTNKLLFFQPTQFNPFASAQFGPYAYRANAAQFFNLLWPVALGLWWHLHWRAGAARHPTQRHHWLLPCVLVLVVAPLVTLSRGGVAVALLQLAALASLFLFAARSDGRARWGMALLLVLATAVAVFFAGDETAKRLRDTAANPLSGREETYRLAARMAEDYPWFGVGPGAYDSMFQLYRESPDDYWPAQLHNDWLEYRITFGRIGSALLLAAGALVLFHWFAPGGLRLHWAFAAGIWIALGGCLLHARFDFPLQIYSIQFVVVLLGAMLFSLSRMGDQK